jgi:hypothetical protein
MKLRLGSLVGLLLAFIVGDGCSSSGTPKNCTISASSYDQSCNVDSDCVGMAGRFAVQFGNFYCQSGCICGGDAINKTSVAQYVQDVSMTPLAASMASCFCPEVLGPCCANNRCTTSCPQGVDGGSADTGSSDAPAGG